MDLSKKCHTISLALVAQEVRATRARVEEALGEDACEDVVVELEERETEYGHPHYALLVSDSEGPRRSAVVAALRNALPGTVYCFAAEQIAMEQDAKRRGDIAEDVRGRFLDLVEDW
jgi:hypothetical protein